MSTPPQQPLNPTSLRYPFELKGQPDEVVQAHRYAFQGLVDLNQAVVSLKSQVATNKQTITTVTSTGGGPIPPSPPFPFPGLGAINDQTGNTTYTVASTDNGILLILSDASPVAVTLNSALTTPYFLFATNLGVGLVTFTPTTGLINGAATYTLAKGYLALIAFDGTNWKTSATLIVPQSAGPTTHEWLASYDATTGVFTLTQPAFSDISGQITTSQLPASGLTATIATAKLTVGGTNGSQTFTNGILTAQTPAT